LFRSEIKIVRIGVKILLVSSAVAILAIISAAIYLQLLFSGSEQPSMAHDAQPHEGENFIEIMV